MKRGATAAGDSPSRSGKKTKKPRAKGSDTTARSGDYELDLNRFPDKLRWLLDNDTAPGALWWLPEGDAIGIRKTVFQEQLLVQEFRGNKFSSITRKLNRWGFRRVDDEERVSEGAIAYSHDFFLRDNVAMMRFMKKEEDRKQNEVEEDAKSSEETRTASLRSLLGEGQPQALHPRHLAGQLRLGHAPHLGNLGLSSLGAGSLLGGPSAPLHASMAQHQLRANLFGGAGVPSSQLLQGNAAALAAWTSSQFPSLQSTSTELSLRNQLTMPAQQQLLLEERHQQLLLEERQQQLRRISAAGSLPRPVTNLSIDPAQALLRRGSHLDSTLLSLPGQVPSSLDGTVNPLLAAAAASQSQNAELLALRRRSLSSFESNRRSRAASIGSAPELTSVAPTTEMNRALLLQQHEQIEQERLLQLRQQLSQPAPHAVASFPMQQAAAAGNLSLSNQMYLLAQAEQEKQEKQQQQGRQKRGEGA